MLGSEIVGLLFLLERYFIFIFSVVIIHELPTSYKIQYTNTKSKPIQIQTCPRVIDDIPYASIRRSYCKIALDDDSALNVSHVAILIPGVYRIGDQVIVRIPIPMADALIPRSCCSW